MSSFNYEQSWQRGYLHRIDDLDPGDPAIGGAMKTYGRFMSGTYSSLHWQRALRYMENILFTAGRHYLDDMMFSKLSQSSNNVDMSVIKEVSRSLPKPINDVLGRYIETNVALLTENRPIPRVSSKSDEKRDRDAAELSELVLAYTWEELGMSELHRELVRLMLVCGTAWLELWFDPTKPRSLAVPEMESVDEEILPEGLPDATPIKLRNRRLVPKRDELGALQYSDDVLYGDFSATTVTPFEMHFPPTHTWNHEMGWVMREYYSSKDTLMDKYSKKKGLKLNKADGWNLEAIEKANSENIQDLPIWWWERVSQIVEGSGPSLYVGDPTMWENYVVVRVFDRQPSAKWPRGRSIITVGDQVLYDSPKRVGARAYDPRWPRRWHPYVHFRWEAMVGSVYGRSLVTKLLPHVKRINSIDTSIIMYRRTVPISSWLLPKGSSPQEGMFTGGSGNVITYDPRITNNQKPEPIFPQPFPKEIFEERNKMFEQMEMIAGTEEILRGQRPVGVNNAAMLNILRKQALASRSSTLQYWDECLEQEGSIILQETIKHIKDDPVYAERLRILAREKLSRQTIAAFSGSDLSDNVQVKVDTSSMALASREAKQAQAIDFLQYAPALVNMPIGIRNVILQDLGYDRALEPQGPDVERAKLLVSWIKQGDFRNLIPLPVDDPYIFYEIFVTELKNESFFDLNPEQQTMILKFIEAYKMQIEVREQQKMQQAMQMQAMQKGGMPPQGGGGPPQ